MENLDGIILVLMAALVVSLLAMFTAPNEVKAECRAHKWEEQGNDLVCSVCKYKAHS